MQPCSFGSSGESPFLSRAARSRTRKSVPASLGVAAKAAFARAFAESGMTRVALAEELGLGETEIRRMLDPEHATKLDRLNQALPALGRRLVLGDMRAA